MSGSSFRDQLLSEEEVYFLFDEASARVCAICLIQRLLLMDVNT